MEPEQQQPWKINVYAKSKNFNFRFKATSTLSLNSCKFHRLSIFLRLHKFLLQVKSESPIQQRRTLKSKFIRAFKKFQARRAKKQSVPAKETFNLPQPETKSSVNQLGRLAYEEPVCTGSLVVGILAFLFQSISGIDRKGIIVLSSVILLYFAILFKKHITGKSTAVLASSIVATVVCSLVCQGYIADFVWKAWNYVCPIF